MIRFLLPIFLLLAAFPLAAQGCYENLQNGAGVSADPSRASTIACKLRESLPEANRASFTTYSASLYRFAGNFAPGAAEALVTRLEARAAAASPYYLLIVWEASGDNLFATPHVRVNLPADGPFACLNPLRRSAWQARLLLQAQGDAPNAKDPEAYLKAETRLMEELMGYVKDLIKCCQQGQTCPDCITRKERVALLKAYPFRTIGQTSYDPAALKSRVDNVEIPGNSTAQIRDGIGIPLDLGGGPVDIAEVLKQLALEKPELGLNALIVHDSLLCDPELAPGRFFGGSGLRSVGSQLYVILQRDGNLDVSGDGAAKEALLKMLNFSTDFVEPLIEIVSETKPSFSPCNNLTKENTKPEQLFYTPSGKLIKINSPITPILANSENSKSPTGSLIGFYVSIEEFGVIRNRKYVGMSRVLDKDNRFFLGYLEESYIEGLQKAGIEISSREIGTDSWLKNTYSLVEQNISSGQITVKWIQNKVAFEYTWQFIDQGSFGGKIFAGNELLPSTSSPISGCEPCEQGPGYQFFKEVEGKFTAPLQRLKICQIAAIFNKLGQDVVDAFLNGDWTTKGMKSAYGSHEDSWSKDEYLAALEEYLNWYNQREEVWTTYRATNEQTKLAMSITTMGKDKVSDIILLSRINNLSFFLDKSLTALGWDKTYVKKAVISLISNVKDDDKEALFKYLIEPDRISFLFSSSGFGNVYGKETFKEFVKSLVDLWAFGANKKPNNLKIYPGILILGRVAYSYKDDEGNQKSVECDVNLSGDLNGKTIDMKAFPTRLVLIPGTENSSIEDIDFTALCSSDPPKSIIHDIDGAIPVYFLTEEPNLGIPPGQSVIPSFLLPYFSKEKNNQNTREAIEAAINALEVAGFISGIGAISIFSRLSTLEKVVNILDVVSTGSEYTAHLASPLIKQAFGAQNTAKYETFMSNWNKLNQILGIGAVITNGTQLVNTVIDLGKSKQIVNFSTTEAKELNGHVIDLVRATGEAAESFVDDLADLVNRLKARGMNSEADIHANLIYKAIKNRVNADGVSASRLTNKFIDLYAQSPELAKNRLRLILTTWNNSKISKFFVDLEKSSVYNLLISKGDKSILAWDFLYSHLPNLNLEFDTLSRLTDDLVTYPDLEKMVNTRGKSGLSAWYHLDSAQSCFN